MIDDSELSEAHWVRQRKTSDVDDSDEQNEYLVCVELSVQRASTARTIDNNKLLWKMNAAVEQRRKAKSSTMEYLIFGANIWQRAATGT